MAVNLINLEKVSKSFTERMLFKEIDLGINEGDKVGVIGINGTGKSTLLKLIAGLEEADAGKITKMNGLRISYLPQTPVFDDSKPLIDNVVEGLVAKEEYRNLRGEAAAMLAKLGISDPQIKPSILSGGQRKRASLVRTLLTDAEVLVLDEPTNHLDNEMSEWLEDILKKRKGAFIMITHDRYFLDRVTNKIVELDKGKLYSYQTNYSGFLELKAEREEMARSTESKAKNLYRIELAWMQRGARARSTKQKAHIERFEELRDREKIKVDGNVQINALSSRLGRKTIELSQVGKAYGDKRLFKDFTYILLPEDRVGIVGRNGAGKSTLLNVMTGRLEPDEGSVDIGTTVKIGYFSQENETLDMNKTVLEYVRDTAEYIETTEGKMSASVMCEQFLFDPSMQYTKIAKLSGGEKRRLYLLKVLMEQPNILVLDEPTNDLDIKTLNILEDYLSTFPGIVVTVSHDRYFLDKIVTRIFEVRDGEVRQFEGNYSDYREVIKAEGRDDRVGEGLGAGAGVSTGVSGGSITCGSADAASGSAASGTYGKKSREEKLKFSYKEQKEFETIDDDIAKLEETIVSLEKEIAASGTNYTKLTELMGKKDQAEADLAYKMDRWVYLTDLAEQIEAQKQGK